MGKILPSKNSSSRYCQKLSPSCLEVLSRGRCWVVDVQHLLHHEETRVPLVVARDSKAKLLVDVDSSLVVVPHVGDDVVHVPLLRLLQHPLHQLLGHSLPPVPVQGANEPEVESVIVGQLATNCSSQHVVPISEEGEPGILLDELAPLVGGHVGHREDREDLLVDVSEGGEMCYLLLLADVPEGGEH